MARFRWLVLLSVLALFAAEPVRAQDEYLELHARYSRPQPYVELFVLPADSIPIAFFSLRVPNALLVFMREKEDAGSPFIARIELTVQVHDGERLVAERVWRTTHGASSYEESVSREQDFEALIPLALPPGSYFGRVLVRDSNSDAPLPTRPLRLEVPDHSTAVLGLPIVTTVPPDLPEQLSRTNLGGLVPMGTSSWITFPVSFASGLESVGASLTYRWFQARHREERSEVRQRRQTNTHSSSGRWWKLPGLGDEPVKGEEIAMGVLEDDGWIGLEPLSSPYHPTDSVQLRLRRDEGGRHYLVSIPVPRSMDGPLLLEVAIDGVFGEMSRLDVFETHWRNMPISLHSLQTAIRNLSFIESKERVRALLSGSEEDRRRAFDSYWSGRDPTPHTSENELMEEYYRRIDHAASEFRTGKRPGPDGLGTDQARVYVVHGPPERVERSFPASGGVEETWIYGGGRRFVFSAASAFDPLALKER